MTKRIESGLLAGAVGAGCMTALRTIARRADWIDETVPEVTVEWLRGATPLPDPPGGMFDRTFLEAFHVMYGAAWGAIGFPALARSKRVVLPGLAFGLLTWAAGIVPMHRLAIARPVWRTGLRENGVNLLAHVLYGLVTLLLAQELARMPLHGATTATHRESARVG